MARDKPTVRNEPDDRNADVNCNGDIRRDECGGDSCSIEGEADPFLRSAANGPLDSRIVTFGANKQVTIEADGVVVQTLTVNTAGSAEWRMGDTRAIRYTPAVTMVAAWMRADTGVGPSMASGSHT